MFRVSGSLVSFAACFRADSGERAKQNRMLKAIKNTIYAYIMYQKEKLEIKSFLHKAVEGLKTLA